MLPNMVAAEDRREYQIISQGGLDLTENPTAGELSDSIGITTDSYPVIRQRKNRQALASYARPTAIYYWNGLLVVDGTSLIYNGQVVGNVSDGEKQFAVVNTKLCIFPDKVFLDLNDLAVRPLAPEFRVAANTASFTEHGITISDAAPVLSVDTAAYPFGSETPRTVMTYSSLSFSDGVWTKNGAQVKLIQDLAAGDLLIPSVSDAGVVSINTCTDGEWSGDENNIGIYVKVKENSSSSSETEHAWEKFSVVSSTYEYYKKTKIASHLIDTFSPAMGYALCNSWEEVGS